jgi:acyl-CoA synthetase (AMP-forming)/AMP-acid ligase II
MSRSPFVPKINVKNLVELLRGLAYQDPDYSVYTYLVDGESEEVSLTHHELDLRARAIGARLQDLGATSERVLLLFPPGIDYITAFFGCLYAGAVAVPTYPPDPMRLERTMPRFMSIVNDAQPSFSLTTGPVLSMAQFFQTQYSQLRAMHWLATDALESDLASAWREPVIEQKTLAFLQYTSGSTSEPKGVMLTHGNLLNNLAQIANSFGLDPDNRGLIWLPPYHDMGLVGGILEPLYAGIPVVLMSPLDFLQRPLRWLQAITRYRSTVSGGPNFAYELCIRKVKPEQRESLDLSSWQVAFNGAEPIRAQTLERFVEAFAPCGFRRSAFYPCYGLAEVCVFGTGGLKTQEPIISRVDEASLTQGQVVIATTDRLDTVEIVSSGRTWLDQRIAIVDPETKFELPPGHVGEIWFAGKSVAQGYWQKPEISEETFQARIMPSGEGPFLRTGDLGFIQDGELFVTGRIKDLIIIDGLNRYPQDIELTVENSHPALRKGCSAAFSILQENQERLVVAVEITRHKASDSGDFNPEDIRKAIRRSISKEHDLRVHEIILLKAGTIPKTSSGKIKRHACKDGFLASTLELWE